MLLYVYWLPQKRAQSRGSHVELSQKYSHFSVRDLCENIPRRGKKKERYGEIRDPDFASLDRVGENLDVRTVGSFAE